MARRDILLLFVIAFVAFTLRFYRVTEIPPSLNWDEVSIGYNAYSILKTGRDEWGRLFPIHFRAYGEYKLPAQVYASIPGIAIFGLNELGVRITPIIYGTLTVILLFFLTKALFEKAAVSLLSAFLLAISPWHIHLTRASFESSFSVFWIVLGIWFLIKGFKDSKWFIYSMVPLAISVYTYNTARVFIPLFLISISIAYYSKLLKTKKAVLISLALFSIMMIPLVLFIFSGESNARYKLVSITDEGGLVPRINEARGNSNLPQPIPRLIHNKLTYLSYYFIRNYTSHFTPDFLFISGAPHKQHHVQGVGQLYAFQAPFLLIGLYLLFRRSYDYRWLILGWIVLSFVPVSVTADSIPHALRTVIVAPVYQLITAFGIVSFYNYFAGSMKKRKYFIIGSFLVIVAVSVFFYLRKYYLEYPYLYSKDWQYGYKQVIDYVSKNMDRYDEIVFTRHYGEPHMFTLFFLQYDPASYQLDPNLIRFETFDWVRVLRFNKFYFPDLGDKDTMFEDIVSENRGKKMLFIGKRGDFLQSIPKLETFNFLNGDPAFDIVEVR